VSDALDKLRTKVACVEHYLQDPDSKCPQCEVEILYKSMEETFVQSLKATRALTVSGAGLRVGQTAMDYIIEQLEAGAKI